MYRILLADDEKHITDWLHALLASQDRMEFEVYKAFTGPDAIRILDEMKVDIVLLDIKMPGYSGLQIADKITQNWPRCRIIFLTGFDSFEYIYEAGRYNYTAYLLKTESDQKILEAVYQAVRSLELEKSEASLPEPAIQKELLLKHFFNRAFLMDIIAGKSQVSNDELCQWYFRDLILTPEQPVFYMETTFFWTRAAHSAADFNNRILKLYGAAEAVLQGNYRLCLLDMSRTEVLWFLQPSTDCTLNDPFLYLKESINDIIQYCQNYLSCELLLIMSEKPEMLSDIWRIHEQIAGYCGTCLAPDISRSSRGVLFGSNLPDLKPSDSRQALLCITDQQLNNLAFSLNQGNLKELLADLRLIRQAFIAVKSMHCLPAIEAYLHISALYLKHISSCRLEEKISFRIGIHPLYFLNEFQSWEDAFDYLERLSVQLFQIMEKAAATKNMLLIDSIKSYIQDNLPSDLSLTVISRQVCYNSSYISHIFKKITGESLFQYINQARIKRAGELLEGTEMTVQEIAFQVGYDTPQYFNRVFKNMTGLTPREYRSRLN